MMQLSGTDSLFLSTEMPTWHQHVGGVIVVDPADSDRFSFEAVRAKMLESLEHVPKFRYRVKDVPLQLGKPVWVEDADFSLDRHLRRIAVAAPGGRREVGDMLGLLCSHQLDRSRPLWEMWYVEGVAGGQVAIMSKYHHCIMDGAASAGLADQLLDIEPDPAPRAPVPEGPEARPPGVSDLELLTRSVVPLAKAPVRVVDYGVRAAQRGLVMLQQRKEHPLPRGASGPCFNGAVGPRRASAFVSISLADVRALKDAIGVKLNDVVLALVAGSVRAHLWRHGDVPDGELVAGVPLSTRAGDGGGGSGEEPSNQIAIMNVLLATRVDDPVERVRAIHESTESSKALTEAIRSRRIPSVGDVVPPLLLHLGTRAAWSADVGRRMPVLQNLLVSNVAGPPFPLYLCGAKVSGIYASSVLAGNQGLNVTLMSYMDRVDFGITADPDLVDDTWEFADGIAAALAELMDAAGLGAPTPVDDAFSRAR